MSNALKAVAVIVGVLALGYLATSDAVLHIVGTLLGFPTSLAGL